MVFGEQKMWSRCPQAQGSLHLGCALGPAEPGLRSHWGTLSFTGDPPNAPPVPSFPTETLGGRAIPEGTAQRRGSSLGGA